MLAKANRTLLSLCNLCETTQYTDEPVGEMDCGFRVKMTKADLLYFSLSHLHRCFGLQLLSTFLKLNFQKNLFCHSFISWTI